MRKGGLLSMDERKLQNMTVDDKFAATFRRIMIYAVSVVVILLITVVFAFMGIRTMYQEYKLNTLQSEMRIDIQAYAKQAWLAISTYNPDTQAECLEGMNEKADAFSTTLASIEEVYGDADDLDALKTDVETMVAMNAELQAMYEAGTLGESGMDNGQEIYAYMDGTMMPAIAQMATDLKVIYQEATMAAEYSYRNVIIIIIVFVVFSLLLVMATTIFIHTVRIQLNRSIQEPLHVVAGTVQEMAKGKFDSNLEASSKDELGDVIMDLKHSMEITESIVSDISESMEVMEQGDFTQGSLHPNIYVGDYIPIRDAIDHIANTLNTTFGQVKNAVDAVAQGANNMSQGATDLAEGATDQASAIQQLTASVENVSQQSHNMALSADEGSDLATNVQQDVAVGAEKMQLVTDAMARINEASTKIEEVTNTIESIANQTQLLALNASIEAARAGEAGRGFAVVAEEISELAEQSNQAASNTHDLINSTLEEIRGGNGVVDQTRDALNKVQESVNDMAEMMKKSGETAKSQARAMEEITRGIEQISGVIQNNSATAEESSAVSQELSEQSGHMSDLMNQFVVH